MPKRPESRRDYISLERDESLEMLDAVLVKTGADGCCKLRNVMSPEGRHMLLTEPNAAPRSLTTEGPSGELKGLL